MSRRARFIETGQIGIPDSAGFRKLVAPAILALLATELLRSLVNLAIGINDLGVKSSEVKTCSSKPIHNEDQAVAGFNIYFGIKRNVDVSVGHVLPFFMQPVLQRPNLIVVVHDPGNHAIANVVAFRRSVKRVERIKLSCNSRLQVLGF